MYSMKDLSRLTGKTEQTIYRLGRENSDFKSVLKENQRKVSNGKRYGAPVLQWLLNHYEITAPTEQDPHTPSVSAPEPILPEPTARPYEILIRENEALQGQIEILKAENDMLRSQLAEKTALWREDRDNLGQALLLLNQERETVKLLLPAPRVPFTEKLKNLFKKKDG